MLSAYQEMSSSSVNLKTIKEDDEREDLQKREDGTLDGEKTGEFEIATVQDIF